MKLLRDLQVTMQTDSSAYPGISGETIANFCASIGLVDKGSRAPLNLAAVDRLFIASTYRDLSNRGKDKDDKQKPKAVARGQDTADSI